MADLVVILVHGGNGTPEMWDPVVTELDARGVRSIAADLPTALRIDATLADDAECVRQLAFAESSTVLCAHSWGGSVITEAGCGLEGLAHLVYIAAFVPDRGETTAAWGGKRLLESAAPMTFRDDGTMVISTWPGLVNRRYDGAAVQRMRAWPAPRPFVASAAVTPLTEAAWRQVPSTYVLASRDTVLHPDTQREMAARTTRVIEMDSDHAVMAVFPKEIADLLASLAQPSAP
jgi:pimeloyl-ACP methyl ester carboxylesterase